MNRKEFIQSMVDLKSKGVIVKEITLSKESFAKLGEYSEGPTPFFQGIRKYIFFDVFYNGDHHPLMVLE